MIAELPAPPLSVPSIDELREAAYRIETRREARKQIEDLAAIAREWQAQPFASGVPLAAAGMIFMPTNRLTRLLCGSMEVPVLAICALTDLSCRIGLAKHVPEYNIALRQMIELIDAVDDHLQPPHQFGVCAAVLVLQARGCRIEPSLLTEALAPWPPPARWSRPLEDLARRILASRPRTTVADAAARLPEIHVARNPNRRDSFVLTRRDADGTELRATFGRKRLAQVEALRAGDSVEFAHPSDINRDLRPLQDYLRPVGNPKKLVRKLEPALLSRFGVEAAHTVRKSVRRSTGRLASG
jgi:hypothetical protein